MACFANSAGGTVVVGVADSDSGPAALVGCDLESERAKHRIFEPTNPGLALWWARRPPGGNGPALDAAAVVVSVLVSFVVVHGGSVTLADRLVEHVADVDDRG
jgi:hypothetical protein